MTESEQRELLLSAMNLLGQECGRLSKAINDFLEYQRNREKRKAEKKAKKFRGRKP